LLWLLLQTSRHSRKSSPKDRILYWICWGAILVLAILFRILPIRSGLPYSDYVDEGHVLHQTIDAFNNRSLDVYWYGLPSLPAYCAGASLLLYGPFYHHFYGHRFQKDLPHERDVPSSKLNYDLIAPVELIVAGRMATACLSIASVVLAGILAARFAKDRAGLLAMLLVAVCPALVTRGSIVIVDTFATFFVLVVLYVCARIQAEESKPVWRDVALAGLATGLAFASKYPAATVGLAVIMTILMLSVRWRRRLFLFFLTAAGLLIGILLGAPMTFLKPITVWRDIVANIRAYAEIHSPEGYLVQAISRSELGVPLLLVGFVGIILMLRQAKTRTVALGWVCFAAMLIASFMGKSFRPFRSLLPLIPPLCIAAAIAFSDLIDWARRGAYPWLRSGVTGALIVGCVGSLAFSSFQQVQRRMAHQDSRIQAVDWLQQHATNKETVLGIRELMILPAEWKRIAGRSTVVPWFEAADLLERERFDYIVTGEFDLRYSSDPNGWSAYLDRWKARVSLLPVQADFGQIVTPVVPYLWRTNDERILILKGNVP
jgi:Dolichyl-phosphate-mannose-protein mannosyltransferase